MCVLVVDKDAHRSSASRQYSDRILIINLSTRECVIYIVQGFMMTFAYRTGREGKLSTKNLSRPEETTTTHECKGCGTRD